MSNSFYSQKELKEIGFKSIGENVLISKKASIYSPEKIEIGNNVRIDDFSILSGKINLGDYIHIAAYASLFGGECGIIMEDFTTLSSKVSTYAISDDYTGESLTNPMIPNKFKKLDTGMVKLEKHVIIGAGSIILPNSIIKIGTAVGAVSLVNKSLDEWSIYAGNPIKKIKERSKRLLELEEQFLKEKE
jgi:galactoside O-acetyltransferase